MTAIDDLTRLRHIQDAAREALFFMSGKTRADLANDRMLMLAVVKLKFPQAKNQNFLTVRLCAIF